MTHRFAAGAFRQACVAGFDQQHPIMERDGSGEGKTRRFAARGLSRALFGGALFWLIGLNLALAQPHKEQSAHAGEAIGTIEQVYDGTLTPDEATRTFRNIDRLAPSRPIKAGGTVHALPVSQTKFKGFTVKIDDRTYDYYDFLAVQQVTGLIILKDGKLVHELYQRGNTADTRWMSMSIAKSVTSTLAGVAVQDGYIRNLDANVTDYVPALKGSAYDGVSVRDVLMMSSGVGWDEAYTDPRSDRRALLRAQIARQPGGAMKVMANLKRAGAPGTVHNYSTGETQVLAEVIHRATGKPLAEYLSEKIWKPYGMQADASWWLESENGVEIGGSGISATLRDYARFGQFILEGGAINGRPVVPASWVAEATTPRKFKNGETIQYGYMWWPGWTDSAKKDGAYLAMGIYGQNIYINPARHVIIATTAALPKPGSPEIQNFLTFLDAIANSLD